MIPPGENDNDSLRITGIEMKDRVRLRILFCLIIILIHTNIIIFITNAMPEQILGSFLSAKLTRHNRLTDTYRNHKDTASKAGKEG
jgi:hypothetical protein